MDKNRKKCKRKTGGGKTNEIKGKKMKEKTREVI